jgi:hypothetical protein
MWLLALAHSSRSDRLLEGAEYKILSAPSRVATRKRAIYLALGPDQRSTEIHPVSRRLVAFTSQNPVKALAFLDSSESTIEELSGQLAFPVRVWVFQRITSVVVFGARLGPPLDR